MKIAFTIFGQACSKANSRQLVTISGRPAFIKSKDARAYERDALRQIPATARQRIEGPCRITIRVWYSSERPDLDPSVILDCLQDRWKRSKGKLKKIAPGEYAEGEGERVLVQAGVVRNDRQFREMHFYHAIDKANPRAEIEIEPLVAQQVGMFHVEPDDAQLRAAALLAAQKQPAINPF